MKVLIRILGLMKFKKGRFFSLRLVRRKPEINGCVSRPKSITNKRNKSLDSAPILILEFSPDPHLMRLIFPVNFKGVVGLGY